MTVFTKEKKAIMVMRSDLCTLFAVSGRAQDRSYDMAKRLNVTKKTFLFLVENLWGETSLPNLSLTKNIQDGSVGFSDETLKEYGWVEAKESGVGLLAFFAGLSPEQRKVLEAENREWRRSLNEKTGEMELVKVKIASKRQRIIEWKDQYQLDKRRYNKKYRYKYKGERCPLGKPCPGCEIKRSKMWALIPQTTERFVQIGKEKGYNVRTDFVKRFWIRRSPGLSEEMFDEDKTRRGMVCSDCFHSALKLWSGFVGATRINIPIR